MGTEGGTGAPEPIKPQAGQGPVPGAGGDDDEDRPLTRAEARALEARLQQSVRARDRNLRGELEGVRSMTLSQRVKADDQVLDSVLTDLKALGVQVDDAVLERLRQGRLRKHIMAADEGQPARQPSQPRGRGGEEEVGQGPYSPGVQAAADAAWEIMQEHGVIVEQNDPEMELINLATNSPSVFLQSITTASKAKAKRLGLTSGEGDEGEEQEPEPEPSLTRRARIPSSRKGPSPTSFEGMDAIDMLTMGYKKTTPQRGG